jgi:RimJ/RimL family protein N-acetyltransferase
LTGTDYAIIAPKYQKLREGALEKRRQTKNVEKILVSLGGTNLNNCTGFALEAIEKYVEKPLVIDVVLGNQAYKLDAIKQQIDKINIETKHEITFHINTTKMHELMLNADLAIGAGGTTSWERCSLGLPTIMIEIADNQRFISKSLHDFGAVHNLGKIQDVTADDLTQALIKYTTSSEDTVIMSEKSNTLCDGRGSDRILPHFILDTALKNDKSLSLRFMTIDDADIVYEWQSHPGLRQYSRNTAIPSKEEHVAWMASSLNNQQRYPYIVLEDQTPVGIIRLDKFEGLDNRYEISILTAPAAANKGVASGAHELLRQLHPNAEILAEVSAENIASLKFFRKMHYIAVSENQYLLKAKD